MIIGKIVRMSGVTLLDRLVMKKVNVNEYLGVIEVDKMKEKKMMDISAGEYKAEIGVKFGT